MELFASYLPEPKDGTEFCRTYYHRQIKSSRGFPVSREIRGPRSRAGDRPLQHELAGDEEQGRRQCEAQDRVGHAHRYVAADDDPRQRAGEQ
jgi:hypothetical protein